MVDLTLEQPGDHHFVRSVSELGIRIGETYYQHSLVVTATRLITDWAPQRVEELQAKHLELLVELEAEVVLIGTGAQQHFLPPRDMFRFYGKGIGLEVMATDAACRTFNVLVTDGRNVAAALMPRD